MLSVFFSKANTAAAVAGLVSVFFMLFNIRVHNFCLFSTFLFRFGSFCTCRFHLRNKIMHKCHYHRNSPYVLVRIPRWRMGSN